MKGAVLNALNGVIQHERTVFRRGLCFKVSYSILIGGKIWMSIKCCWVFFMLLMGAVVMLSQFMVDLAMMQMRHAVRSLFAMKH